MPLSLPSPGGRDAHTWFWRLPLVQAIICYQWKIQPLGLWGLRWIVITRRSGNATTLLWVWQVDKVTKVQNSQGGFTRAVPSYLGLILVQELPSLQGKSQDDSVVSSIWTMSCPKYLLSRFHLCLILLRRVQSGCRWLCLAGRFHLSHHTSFILRIFWRAPIQGVEQLCDLAFFISI